MTNVLSCRGLRGLVGILMAAVSLALPACTTNPATGRRIFTGGLTREQEVSLGAEAAPQFTQEFGGPVPDESLQSYVDQIGQKLAKETESYNPGLPWEFTLLNTPVVNAFALPGGKVFFTRGLAEKLTNESQMAGVMGHEIGHVTAQHGAQRIANQTAFNVGLAVAAVFVSASDNRTVQQVGSLGVPALAIGGNLVMLKYGRDEELEADRLGMRYMANVGYNPRGQLEVMQVLASLSQGASRPPEFLSTHPDPQARIQQIQRLLETEYANTQGNSNYQAFEGRYKSQFLTRLNQLPPAPAPPPQQQGNAGGPSGVTVAGAGSWCGLCAAGGAPRTAREMLIAAAAR